MTITVMAQGGTVCVARDITRRLAAERARTETETKYRALIEQVAAVSYIAELGIHGVWLYVSPQVETIFGYTPDEWLSQSDQWTRFIPAEDHPIIHAAEEACLSARRFQAEYRITRKDGQVIWVSDTAVPVMFMAPMNTPDSADCASSDALGNVIATVPPRAVRRG